MINYKILYISDIDLYNTVPFGGVRASLKTIELLRENHSVDVEFIGGHKKTDKLKESFVLKNKFIFYFLSKIHRFIKKHVIDSTVTLDNRKASDKALYLKSVIDKKNYDFIFINSIFIFPMFENYKSRIVIDSLDLMHARYNSFTKSNIKPWFYITQEQEIEIFKSVNGVILIQPEEEFVVRSLGVNNTITFERPWVIEREAFKFRSTKNIVFVGGASNFNIDGIHWFIKEVFPKLNKYFELQIFGSVCDRLVLEEHPRVHINGKFDKPLDAYQDAFISINPSYYGSGLKTKNLESLSFAVPVLTTQVGAQGMGQYIDRGLILKETAEDWINYLNKGVCVESLYQNTLYGQSIILRELGELVQLNKLNSLLETEVD